LTQRGVRRSNFYAVCWINVLVGVSGLWSAVLLFVPREAYSWRAVPYFVLSGVLGTTGGRLFRVIAIEKVGAPVAASIGNLTPLMSTGLAILLLGEHVTVPIIMGTLVIVFGTVLLSQSGKHVGFLPRHLVYPFVSASCFAVVAIFRKLGLFHAGPLFGSAVNMAAAMITSTTFVLATGNRDALRCDRQSLLYFAGAGACENTGVLLFLMALGLGEVSVVTPLAGVAPPFVLLLAVFFSGAPGEVGGGGGGGGVVVVLGVVFSGGGRV